MQTLIPLHPLTAAHLAVLMTVELAAGFFLQRDTSGPWARPLSWSLAAVSTLLADRIAGDGSAGFRMLALIGALFLGMKAVVGSASRAEGRRSLPFARWALFAAAWPGMDPRRFAAPPHPGGLPGWKGLRLHGSLCFLAGIASMALAGELAHREALLFPTTVLFFIGSSLSIHYGLFTLLAAVWRRKGFDCGPLFLNPLPSESLGEFWGKKWNLAFHEMTALAVHRPLGPTLPRGLALFISFGFSGLLHEIAISLPVDAGYGGPLGYFLLQGGLVAFERRMAGGKWAIRGWFGRCWTYFWILLPLPVLFHRHFLEGVVWPLFGVTG